MPHRQFIQLQLTCSDRAEADKISRALLDEHLVACAKLVPISSRFWWEAKQETSDEMLLIMESATDLFDAVEAKVAGLHSFDTFVLQSLPVLKVSAKAQAWLEESMRDKSDRL